MSRSFNHWYPRYPADYAKKTKHLSLVEHGAYVLLMDHYYSTQKPLPANAVQLHRICMAFADDEQAACMRVLHEFFTLGPDGWTNARVEEELQKRNEISDKRSNAAQKRYAKAPAIGDANAGANANTSTATDIKKEEAKASSKEKRASRLSVDWVLPQSWGMWAVDQGMTVEQTRSQADRFKDYWLAKAGKDGAKRDWEATWRNWCRKFIEDMPKGRNNEPRRHDRTEFDRAIARVADDLAAGSIQLDTSSRDPFAR